jgi:methyl-accepting chemotaxis protein
MNPSLGHNNSPSVKTEGESIRVNRLFHHSQSVHGPGEVWIEQLRRLSETLHILSGQTEKDFLVIGALLHDFYRQAGDISKMSATVAELMSGDDIAGAIRGLSEVLKWLNDYLTHLNTEIETESRRLQLVLQISLEARQSLLEFKEVMRRLTMLGISTRIESARLDHKKTGFNTLADQIEHLATLIRSKSAAILGHLNLLGKGVKQALGRVMSLQTKQRRQAQLVLGEVQDTLAVLTGKHELSAITAAHILARSAEIYDNIGQVVVSIQFQDITRQQMEHVKSALDEIAHRLTAEVNPAALPLALIVDTAAECQTQGADLSPTITELVTAVAHIIESLHNIAANVVTMSGETRQLTGSIGETSRSFLAEMGRELTTVTANLTEITGVSRELSQAMTAVAGAAAEIFVFVADMEAIGTEIELIALNARIEAAHLETEGAALGVLAEAVQRLAADTRQQIKAIADMLTTIAEAAEEPRPDLETPSPQPHQDREANAAAIVIQLEGLLQAIQRANNRVVSLLSDIDLNVQELSDKINRSVIEIDIHHTVDQGAGDVIGTLAEIAAQAWALAAEAGYTGAAPARRAETAPVRAPAVKSIHPPDDIGDDFGDNIELF